VGQVDRIAIAIGQGADHHAGEPAVAVKYGAAGFAFLRAHAHDHGVRIAEFAILDGAAKAHGLNRAKAGRIALRMGFAKRKKRGALHQATVGNRNRRMALEAPELDQRQIMARQNIHNTA
jgi:hypothetical protein